MRTPPLAKEYLEALDFYRLFLQLITELHTKAKFQMTWYRGQSQDWPLIPGILRPPYSKHTGVEAGILNSFKRLASAQMTRPLSNREWYYLAQHHGIPTRLLDWTANPRIALWFAIEKDDDQDQDGFIYIIDAACYRNGDVLNSLTLIENDYYETVFGNGSFEHIEKWDGKIKAIFPDCYSARQMRQTSMFTLHLPGDSSEKINPIPIPFPKHKSIKGLQMGDNIFERNHPISIQIPHKYKPHLRRLLSIEGLHLWDVFPDLDHIATGLKEEIFGTNPADSPPANNQTN